MKAQRTLRLALDSRRAHEVLGFRMSQQREQRGSLHVQEQHMLLQVEEKRKSMAVMAMRRSPQGLLYHTWTLEPTASRLVPRKSRGLPTQKRVRHRMQRPVPNALSRRHGYGR